MVDVTSVALGAGALYAVIIHMVVTYLYAARQVGEESVSAGEAEIVEGQA